MINLSNFAATHVAALNATPSTWTNPGPRSAVVVLVSVDAILALDGEPTAADFKLLANTYGKLRVDPGAVVGYVAADADAVGEIRLTLAGDD